MSSIDEILAVVENPDHRRSTTVRILLRQDLVERHARLDQELADAMAADARLNRDPVAPTVADEILALEAELEAAKVPFMFRSIGRKAWADLIAAHPPTQAQRLAYRGVGYNPETFPIAALAASAVEPAIDLPAAHRLEAALNDSQFELLWTAALEVNRGVDAPKSGVAGRIRRTSDAFGSTAAIEESLDPSSSGE